MHVLLSSLSFCFIKFFLSFLSLLSQLMAKVLNKWKDFSFCLRRQKEEKNVNGDETLMREYFFHAFLSLTPNKLGDLANAIKFSLIYIKAYLWVANKNACELLKPLYHCWMWKNRDDNNLRIIAKRFDKKWSINR